MCFFKNAGRSISSNAWWNMIISHIVFNDVDGNDVNLWMVHQATPGCFVPSWPSTDPRSFPTTPRSSCHIQAIQTSRSGGETPDFCNPIPVLRLPSLSCQLGSIIFWWCCGCFKKKKNILDTTWHHSKISPDTHFLHPRLAILSWVWVELTIPYVFQYFPVGSYLKSKKYRKITERSRWLSSPPSKSASCAAAAAWDKDSERWKPHRITERSMAFWVIKMRCLE